MNFIKNLYYNKKTGIFFTILIFSVPILMTISGEDKMLGVWIVFIVIFLIIYGIPANIISNRQKRNLLLKNNLGIRLVKEVNERNKDQYSTWNSKNKEHLDAVKNFVIQKLTKNNEKSLDEIKKIDERIVKLKEKIKDEKSSTNEIMQRHPFMKTLKEIQNRAN